MKLKLALIDDQGQVIDSTDHFTLEDYDQAQRSTTAAWAMINDLIEARFIRERKEDQE